MKQKISQRQKASVSELPRRPSLFWDVDPETVDPKKHARYIIERILDFGTDKEVKWMWDTYPHSLIRDVVDTSRVLHPKTRALWELLIPQNQNSIKIRCPMCEGSGYTSRSVFFQSNVERNQKYFEQEVPRITKEFLGLK